MKIIVGFTEKQISTLIVEIRSSRIEHEKRLLQFKHKETLTDKELYWKDYNLNKIEELKVIEDLLCKQRNIQVGNSLTK